MQMGRPVDHNRGDSPILRGPYADVAKLENATSSKGAAERLAGPNPVVGIRLGTFSLLNVINKVVGCHGRVSASALPLPQTAGYK